MHSAVGLLALASTASAAVKGFNYGSTFTSGAAKQQSDFESEFQTAQGLVGGSGFTSARLYTMVQGGTANAPISAIPAAIKTKTSLLLGLWASAGDTAFANELAALKSAIETYGKDFTSIVDGISVGSEDLYRNSPMGIKAGSNVGANPVTIANYINQVKKAVSGTGLSAPIGHVDTWTAWVNGSNQAVIDACDWVGVDAYPYFQDTMPNQISKGRSLFDDALGQTQAAVGGKSVWVTETGWPVSGKTVGQAVPSLENAKSFWDDVGCGKLFGKVNTWWYTLQDAAPDTPNPSFGVVGNKMSTQPLFDLSCANVQDSSSKIASATTRSTATGSATKSASATATSGGGTNGSPGLGGLSSQLSLESTATASASAAATATGSGSGASGSGSGSNSTVTTGSPSSKPTSTSTSVPVNAASGLQSGAFGALVLAIIVAIFAL